MDTLKIKKRCGKDPHTLPEGKKSIAANGCPDVFELENGDFAIIGVRVTSVLKANLPESAGCGDDEEIVYVPRHVLANAKQDIPDYKYTVGVCFGNYSNSIYLTSSKPFFLYLVLGWLQSRIRTMTVPGRLGT